MELFLKAAGSALITVILAMALEKQGKDMALLLGIAATVMVVTVSIGYLTPVLDFLKKLNELGNLDGTLVGTLFKILGIGLLGEICAMVCADAGRGSLGKALQITSGAAILWLSIPIFTALIELIQKIMGEL